MPVIAGTGLTGAAVLRATGRIFAGWGRVPGLEAEAPTEDEREPEERPLWLMGGPAVLLIHGALLSGKPVSDAAHAVAGEFLTSAGLSHPVVPDLPASHGFAPWGLGRRHAGGCGI